MHLQQEGASASFNNLFAHCGSLFPFDYNSGKTDTVLSTVLSLIEVSLSKKKEVQR